MQNLPGQPAKAMGNGPNRLVVTEPHQETPIQYLKICCPLVFTGAWAIWLSTRRITWLPTAVILGNGGRLFPARAGAHP